MIGKGDVNAKKILIVGKKAFLMEYPVEYVKKFKKEGDTGYTPVYERSDMMVNILTNQTLGPEGQLAESPMGNRLKVYTDTGFQRLTGDLGVNSFVLDGVKGELTKYGYLPFKNGKELEPINQEKYGRIVLRDYLELFHAPTVVSGENLIATGRMVRITKFKGQAADEMALFIDKSGNEMKNADGALAIKLKAKDFMDIKSGFGNSDKYKLDLKEELNETNTETIVKEGSGSGEDESPSGISGIHRNLKENKVDEIEVATRFPGDRVALNDDLEFRGSTNVEETTPTDSQSPTDSQTPTGSQTPTDSQVPDNAQEQPVQPPADSQNIPVEPEEPSSEISKLNFNIKDYIRMDNVMAVQNIFTSKKDKQLLDDYIYQQYLKEKEPIRVYEVASLHPQILIATQPKKDANLSEEQDRGENETNVLGDENQQKKMKHFFYGMAVDLDPYLSNLVSGWVKVNGDGGDVGSLDWWNYWLGGSGYNYRVDRVKLENVFMGNYNYESKDTGNINVDLNTIAKIQDDLDLMHQSRFIGFIRTMFTILGYFLLAYSFFVMMAWVYDTNVTTGPRILTIVTGGKWVAISVGDEMPTMDLEAKQYMNFNRVLRAAFVISVVGGVLIFLDIVAIVDGIVRVVGAFGNVLWKALRGIK